MLHRGCTPSHWLAFTFSPESCGTIAMTPGHGSQSSKPTPSPSWIHRSPMTLFPLLQASPGWLELGWTWISWKQTDDTTVLLNFCRCSIFREGDGTPLQYSCLENPMDIGAWWAAVHGVANSWTRLSTSFSLPCIGEGNGNPLQCSCLENPRDGGAWWAAVYGVAQSWTRLKRLSSPSSRCNILEEDRKQQTHHRRCLPSRQEPRFLNCAPETAGTDSRPSPLLLWGPMQGHLPLCQHHS